MSFRSSKDAAEGDDRDPSVAEETDTHIDNPLFRATETPRTATFGPAVNRNAPIEEPTDAIAPPLEPTAPMIPRAAGPRSRSATWAVLAALGAIFALALFAAYASRR